MSDPFIGQISLFGFPYAPRGWAQCSGQTLSIAQNQALFSLLGTTFGGNGVNTFGLPNLGGNVTMSSGLTWTQGMTAGEAAHTLLGNEIPPHTHTVNATGNSTGTVNTPTNTLLNSPTPPLYTAPANLVALTPTTVANVGQNQAHENRQPYTVVNFCIALQGIFPSRD
jgi:microcystin-dependent protein